MVEPRWFIRERPPWPFHKQGAVTLWPLGIFVKESAKDRPGLREHELVHWGHQSKWGPLYYLAYGALLPFFGGGRRHPLERAAYAVEDKLRRESGLYGGSDG